MRNHSLVRISFLLVLILSLPVIALADLSQKQARKAISKAAGFSFSSGAVRIERIVSTDASTAEVSSELELVFRVARDERDQWRLVEIRMGEARWESIEAFAQAVKVDVRQDECGASDINSRPKPQSALTEKLARCLIASLFAINLPSDAVRIKEVSGLNLGPHPSALAVSLVKADFRLTKEAGGWSVVGFRSGNRDWITLDSIPGTLDSLRRDRTTEQLKTIAAALEAYKKDRGGFVISDKHSVLIDHLSPHYLSRVLRTDSWQRPLKYQGDRDHYTLRSMGPDGKENTPDDIVISN